jgi:hypothetical protein
MLQIHLSAVAFAMAWGLTLAWGMQRKLLPGLVLGVVLAGVLFVPFLAHEAESGWADLKPPTTVAAPFDLVHEPAPAAWAFSLTGSLRFAGYFLASDSPRFEADFPCAIWLSWLVSCTLLAALAAGVAACCWRLGTGIGLPRPARASGFLMLAWLFLPPLMLWLRGLPFYPHYFIISLPAQVFFAAWGTATGARLLHRGDDERLPRAAFSGLLAGVALVQCLYFAAFNRHLEQVPFREDGQYRATYRFLSEHIREMVSEKGPEATSSLERYEWGAYLLRFGGVMPPGAPPAARSPHEQRSREEHGKE